MAPGALTNPPPRASLNDVRAKSTPAEDRERLTTHSRTVHAAVGLIEDRIANAGVLADSPAFWSQVRRAALLHDAGKIAEGFQRQVEPRGIPWGERHEVLSLAYADLLAGAAAWSEDDLTMVATLVATHHRALHNDGGTGHGGKPALSRIYNKETDWEEAFGTSVEDVDGRPVVQVPRFLHRELLAWFCGFLAVDPPSTRPGDPSLAQRARHLLQRLLDTWHHPVRPHRGLLAVLAQGALTLADRSGSAHIGLQTHMPLPYDYLARLPYHPHSHQRQAAETLGHLTLVAPTGSGKTEAGLAWAATQIGTMPGRPRVVWTLPYRASLNAIRRRLSEDLIPVPGERKADIGLLHGTVAQTLLADGLDDDCPGREPNTPPTADQARKARAQAGAMRLFTQRVRVATPHQLLSGAIAGPAYSSVLLEQANCVFVLDELHAYEPRTFGRLCAAMRLWERLGSRFAVLSATLAEVMIRIIEESVEQPVTVHRSPEGSGPVRHRLTLDELPIDAPESVQRIRDWLNEGHSVLAVVNTVARAQELFGQLADDARAARPGDPHAALLLHSRFRNGDRDTIERALLRRHPERRPGDGALRGGLVVATQAVEVSLQLDFDRAAVECAPVEAVAQRAGRVNRRGLHPDGPVEFRVHRVDGPRPYDPDAMDAAWAALRGLVADGATALSEQDIDELLRRAYATEWGKGWEEQARAARDAFAARFLTFTDPFHDRSEFARELSEAFDSTEVLHHDDAEEYRALTRGKAGDPLLASRLLIPLRLGQLRQFDCSFDPYLKVNMTDSAYDPTLGLQPPAARETIL
ncbi:CRISPR-associated helicase/endonuclease Cas3 [Streptomyces clavuligerus]|uniref:CRISPR-associated helicase/endonuclease Cas3 n=1 Tax=Streptomyces clavuligerus TaxID=1901 RepID=UPI000185161B|nr:CRISPR-associated helicase/endonuclease Cas3 [Streptomyces clavuligerus]WDN51953.1 CRISPR-associated helicase/endonuclease Cas3 [Streptomyces clavuligerus]